MIPIKLAMRNFMCYRDNVPVLYFDGIHTVCISGNNGSGKSALIDAITWALWGQTRARSDDDLVYSGQTETEVEFDFAVGDTPYRIIRKHSRPRSRGRSGQTILEFQIATGDGFRSITGDSVSQTQQKIIDVLHMDYPTFVNSAFLRQGRADEFTVKRPVERKQVLADILGLAFYDRLEKQAKDRAKQQEDERAPLESAIKDISDELARKPDYEAEFEAAREELARIDKQVREQETGLNRLRQERESLQSKKLQLTQLQEHMAATRRDRQRWDDPLKQHRSRIKEYEGLIAQRAAIEDGYAQFTRARQLADELDQGFRQWAALGGRQHQLEMKIQHLGQDLLKAHAIAQTKIKELAGTVQKLPRLKAEAGQVQAELPRLAEAEARLQRKRQNSQELETKVHSLESHQTRLEQEIVAVAERLRLLSTPSGAKCPLCETDLGAEGRQRIEVKYGTERQSKSEALAINQAELVQKKTGLQSLKSEIAQLETRLNEDKTAARSRASTLSQAIAEAEEASNRLSQERSELAEIEGRLASRDFAITEQQALHQLEDELAALSYDARQHEGVRQSLVRLGQYEKPKQRLEEADRLIKPEREAVARAEAAAQELRRSLEVDGQRQQDLTAEISWLPQLVDQLASVEAEYRALAVQREQAQEAMGSVKRNLDRCAELAVKKQEKAERLAGVTKEEKIYRDLALAFGKKGIPALLIEVALPEIEVEANRLLGRMTENRLHVKMETQRETRKGSRLETLDINISDELGTRNYEMFSGGEAFRINFAIRIALSKLLARRAGAPLPTLIIDEGFGTQDSAGIEKLKEAINSIQDDFDKIIVITHIDELKDAFPTRIEVSKTADGSTLEVSA